MGNEHVHTLSNGVVVKWWEHDIPNSIGDKLHEETDGTKFFDLAYKFGIKHVLRVTTGVPNQETREAMEETREPSSVQATLAERGARYGDFATHAYIAQGLQNAMRSTDGWYKLTSSQAQALTVIADKIARILNGDPNYDDNWHDIQGYAKLVEDQLKKEPTTPTISADPNTDWSAANPSFNPIPGH